MPTSGSTSSWIFSAKAVNSRSESSRIPKKLTMSPESNMTKIHITVAMPVAAAIPHSSVLRTRGMKPAP